MNIRQILPGPSLKEHIRYFWILESNDPHLHAYSFRVIADGSPGIVFHQSSNGASYKDDKMLPDLFLYGQATQYTELQMQGPFRTVGIYFHPGALQAVFGFNAAAFTDSCLDLEEIPSVKRSSLTERLYLAASTDEQIELLSEWLLELILPGSAPIDAMTRFAVSGIASSAGSISLPELLKEIGLSERTFERRFRQSVGISPKLFARICRFQASFQQLKKGDFDKLSDIAYLNEYADQSHFIRTFREFAGCTPLQYRKLFRETVENFPRRLE